MEQLNISLESKPKEPKRNKKVAFGITVGFLASFYMAVYITALVEELRN